MFTKTCICGCREEFSTSERRSKYKKGHFWRGKKHSNSTKLKISEAAIGRKHSEESKMKIGKAARNMKRTQKHRERISKSRTGREVVYSPFVPDQIVTFNEQHRRWYCNIRARNSSTGKPKTSSHARAVYEFHRGAVPEGYHVHHISGRHDRLEDDHIDNLMLLTQEWNRLLIPSLARAHGVAESDVTRHYIDLCDTFSDGRLFFEISKYLLLDSDPYLEL